MSWPRFNPNFSTMAFNHTPANCQADASARKLRLGMQALENTKYSVKMFGINADAVVGDRENPAIALLNDR